MKYLMKNFKSLLPFLLMVFALVGCDTDDLRNDVDELKNRVESLEAQVTAINENMNVLQVLVEGNKTIKSCVYDEATKTYKLVLSDDTQLELYQGEDGMANTPEITISDDNKWVINGTPTGVDATGADAALPKFKLDDQNYWMVDLDGDGTVYGYDYVYNEAGDKVQAIADDANVGGDTFFESVDYNEAEGFLEVKLTSTPGTTYKLPVVPELTCKINTENVEEYKDNVLTVGYGLSAELEVEVQGDNYFVTAPSGWTAVLGEVNPNTHKATLTVYAPKEEAAAGTLSRATADNSTDLSLQVYKGGYWAVAKIQVKAIIVIDSYYSLFERGDILNIAGIELKKSDWEDVDNFEIKQISSSGNGTEANKITQSGIYFVQPGAVAVYAYAGAVTNMYILRDKPEDNTAILKMNEYARLNNSNDPVNSKFVCEGLIFDASEASNYQFTANSNFGHMIFKNCSMNFLSNKPLVYISASREFQSVVFENCKLNFTDRKENYLFNIQNTSINSISLVNNVFYTTTDNDVKTQLFGMGTTNDLPELIMKNNTFYNVVPEATGFVICKSLGEIDIQNNLFHSSQYVNYNVLLRFSGDNLANAVSGTGVTLNNYGNKGAKTWKIYNGNSVLEGSSQINNTYETLFSSKDVANGVFTPITELENYGAKLD